MLISSQSGMTGNVVSDRVSAVSSIFGLVFIIGGLGLMIYEERSPKQKIEDIVKQYESGQIDSVHTVAELNKVVQIQNVRYKTGKQHSLVGKRDAYPLKLKRGREAEELAIVEYLLAVKNNPQGIRNNRIEIRKGLSTKHYMEKFQKIIGEFKQIHAKELETILEIT